MMKAAKILTMRRRKYENILETKDLTVTFGGLNAQIMLTLRCPQVNLCLIGPNGAGKTTFIDAITGYVPTSAGNAVLRYRRNETP